MGIPRWRAAGAAILSGLALVAASACDAVANRHEDASAVGWLPDGRMLVVTEMTGHPAGLWVTRPGGRRRVVRVGYCDVFHVTSVFPLSSGRAGLAIRCRRADEVVLVAGDLATGRAALLTSSTAIRAGVWFEPTSRGLVAYDGGFCEGVGEVDERGLVRPLDAMVALPATAMALGSVLPQPGRGAGCQAQAVARAPAVSVNGRYAAFFLHVCDPYCNGSAESAQDWHVVILDRTTGQTEVAGRRFQLPNSLAVSDDRALAISAVDDGIPGVWYCRTPACDQPRRLTGELLNSPSFRPDGAQLAGVRLTGRTPVLLALPR